MSGASAPHDLPPEDPRRTARPRMLKAGKLLCGGFQKTVFDCLIRDLLDRGVRVETAVTIAIPETAQLQIQDEILGPLSKRWASGSQIGFALAAQKD